MYTQCCTSEFKYYLDCSNNVTVIQPTSLAVGLHSRVFRVIGKSLLVSSSPHAVFAKRSAPGSFLNYPVLKEGEFPQDILSYASTRLQSLTRVALPHNPSHFSKLGNPISFLWTEIHIQATWSLIKQQSSPHSPGQGTCQLSRHIDHHINPKDRCDWFEPISQPCRFRRSCTAGTNLTSKARKPFQPVITPAFPEGVTSM